MSEPTKLDDDEGQDEWDARDTRIHPTPGWTDQMWAEGRNMRREDLITLVLFWRNRTIAARQWAAYLYRELGKQGGLCARCGWPYTVHRAGPFTEHRCFRCAVERGEVERD